MTHLTLLFLRNLCKKFVSFGKKVCWVEFPFLIHHTESYTLVSHFDLFCMYIFCADFFEDCTRQFTARTVTTVIISGEPTI